MREVGDRHRASGGGGLPAVEEIRHARGRGDRERGGRDFGCGGSPTRERERVGVRETMGPFVGLGLA